EKKEEGKVKNAMKKGYESLLVTQWWGFWAGYYDYAEMIGVKFDKDKLNLFRDFCSEIPLIYTFNKLAIICKKPIISWKSVPNSKARILHFEKGPSIEYEDGFKNYHLNKIKVPEWVVTTPAEQIDIKKVISEENVDVRRELIRKVGIERFVIKAGAKVLDKKGDYELLSIKLSDEVPDARYLKMKNPSIGIYHCEGVEGNTVQEAINFRARNLVSVSENWEPEVLT